LNIEEWPPRNGDRLTLWNGRVIHLIERGYDVFGDLYWLVEEEGTSDRGVFVVNRHERLMAALGIDGWMN